MVERGVTACVWVGTGGIRRAEDDFFRTTIYFEIEENCGARAARGKVATRALKTHYGVDANARCASLRVQADIRTDSVDVAGCHSPHLSPVACAVAGW
jgi:hypothetical protein